MLYTNFIPATSPTEQQNGVLVFLHGLLGDGSDWHSVISELADFPVLTVDLPGHGRSRNISCDGLEHCCELIQDAILGALATNLQPESVPQPVSVFLIGYSLGARIAMYGLTHNGFNRFTLSGSILEGGNFGLRSEEEKKQRYLNDEHWAQRFKSEPIEQVLSDWYCQPVFSSLNPVQKQATVMKRSHNQGGAVATMLMATSLARQPYLLNAIKDSGIPVHYLCGEKDRKFSELAEQSELSFTRIKDAGHNAHSEQPSRYAMLIRTLVTQIQTR